MKVVLILIHDSALVILDPSLFLRYIKQGHRGRDLVLGIRHGWGGCPGTIRLRQVWLLALCGYKGVYLCIQNEVAELQGSRTVTGTCISGVWTLPAADCSFSSALSVISPSWLPLPPPLETRMAMHLLCSSAVPGPCVSKIADCNLRQCCFQMFIIPKSALLSFIIKWLGCGCFVLERLARLTVCQVQSSALCVICSLPQEQWWPLRHYPSPTA